MRATVSPGISAMPLESNALILCIYACFNVATGVPGQPMGCVMLDAAFMRPRLPACESVSQVLCSWAAEPLNQAGVMPDANNQP
jgi:hypothetical protein